MIYIVACLCGLYFTSIRLVFVSYDELRISQCALFVLRAIKSLENALLEILDSLLHHLQDYILDILCYYMQSFIGLHFRYLL